VTLTVSIINGDLAFVAAPLLVGHYTSLGLSGSEAAVDRLLAGKLQRSLRARDYPEEPGSTKIFRNTRQPFDNPWQLPRPRAVVVVGLGQEGELKAEGLKGAIAKGVVAWALHAEDTDPQATSIGLSATLIGSGGLNFSAGQSAQLIVQAVLDANAHLATIDVPEGAEPPPPITHLSLVDLYLDRAGEAWRALHELQSGGAGDFLLEPHVPRRDAALDRPLESSYRGSSYDLIVATWEPSDNGDASVRYRLDTRRARSEIQARSTQVSLLRQLLADGSNPDHLDRVLGRTLFKLLVPTELAPFLAGSTELQLEVDARTAAIPWELIDLPKDGASNRKPWAIRSKLLRKLRTDAYRREPQDAPPEAGILIIGEPACPAGYARLPGARREARAVKAMVKEAGWTGLVRGLISGDGKDESGPDGRTTMRALLDSPWRIVHICGHGEPALPDNPRGVVLSHGAFLGPREIESMQPVPELVFVNCCYAGTFGASVLGDAATAAGGALADSAQFAANVAAALVDIGVRCVVATGWAVDDSAAEAFAVAFYGSLLRGARFMDAVASARQAAYGNGNTWAAYQCYGDPDWRLVMAKGDAQSPTTALAPALARVSSVPALTLALRTLAVRARYDQESAQATADALEGLVDRFGGVWGHHGDVAQAFGNAWRAAGNEALAIEWLERAVAADDGTATFKAAEDLLNLRAVSAAEAFQRMLDEPGSDAGTPSEAVSARVRAKAGEASAEIEKVIEKLLQLSTVVATSERASLLGSACKRLSMVQRAIGEHAKAADWLVQMRNHYASGWTLAEGRSQVDTFYPAMNLLAASVASGDLWDTTLAARVRELVDDRHRNTPDFWNAVAGIEIAAWEALARGQMARQCEPLSTAFAVLRDRVDAPSRWRSVRDQTRFVVTARRQQSPPPPEERAAADHLVAVLSSYAHSP